MSIALSPETERRLVERARTVGLDLDEFVRRLIEQSVPTAQPTARELLAMKPEDRRAILAAAAERAAPLYNADLARPASERELTAFTILDGEDFEPHGR